MYIISIFGFVFNGIKYFALNKFSGIEFPYLVHIYSLK